MARLPVYTSGENITTGVPGAIVDPRLYSAGWRALGNTADKMTALAEEWQKAKDEVENLDGKNKLLTGVSRILSEAQEYNEYSTPDDITKKQNELITRMESLTPEIVSGFSNNKNAQQFRMQADLTTMQNVERLKGLFRDKYIDMAKSNLMISQDSNQNNFVTTGNENYKQNYFNDIDSMVNAGFIDRETATGLKLKTNDWNFDYAYGQISSNPYAKIPENIMSGIDAKKKIQLRNFQNAEQKRARIEAQANAELDFYTNPTEENLKKIYAANPEAKKSSAKYQKLVSTPSNIETVSNFAGYAEAADAIKDLATVDTRSYNGKMEYLRQAGDIARGILLNNTDKKGGASISTKDKDALIQMIYKGVNDETFKEQLANLPDLSKLRGRDLVRDTTQRIKAGEISVAEGRKEVTNYQKRTFMDRLSAQRKIDDIGRRTAESVLYKFIQGDYQGGQKVYNEGLQEAIRTKYWYIPELQNPNLQAGQKFTVNGKVYSFQGYSGTDIIVESN